MQDAADSVAPLDLEDYLAFVKAGHDQFHGRSGRLRVMLAPSAPQRCTPELMLAANDLAKEWGVPFHTHIVETRILAPLMNVPMQALRFFIAMGGQQGSDPFTGDILIEGDRIKADRCDP